MTIEKAEKEIIEEIAHDWNSDKAGHLHFDNGFSLVAKEGDEIAGFISGYLNENEVFFIDIIDVKPEFRRQGIGTALINESCRKAKSNGAKKVQSWSSLDKEAAIKMWKVIGFNMTLTTQVSEKTHQLVEGYIVEKDL